jgi:hypothetical protein
MKHLADAYRASMNLGSDFLNTTAAYLHPRMINAMKKYGLDGTNRFGFGSDANRAAKKVTNLLKTAADHLIDSGMCVGYAYMAFITDVWQPIQQAKKELQSGRVDSLDV